jgi:hypothetical protein
MTAPTEHALQRAVLKLAKDVITVPHRIRAFDRSRNFSGTQHLAEASRGIRKGTPDVELICAGRSINVELKRPGTKHLKDRQPTDAQLAEMAALRAAGAYADVAWSLAEVVGHWRAAGVPMLNSADIVAQDRDLKLVGAAPRKGGVGRARKPRPSVSEITRWEKFRAIGMARHDD